VALAYVLLTKPRIIVLLLVTTVPAMVLAASGFPSLRLIALTLAGGALTAGGANAVNCYLDRDIDKLMNRTHHRPVPAGRLEAEHALLFGLLLGAAGVLALEAFVNSLAALLALGANAFYVLVYTVWLKRTTAQNIVIGGAAGAMPPVVGWAAVSGTLDLPALVLFGVILIWTPPHFWALALVYSSDYERAGVPMLPIASGVRKTTDQILLYSILLVAVSLSLMASGTVGYVYLVAALLLGAPFIFFAYRLWRAPSNRHALRLFKYSLYYLALLFLTVMGDTLL
jgi:protoheme IX farnesyltransferase